METFLKLETLCEKPVNCAFNKKVYSLGSVTVVFIFLYILSAYLLCSRYFSIAYLPSYLRFYNMAIIFTIEKIICNGHRKNNTLIGRLP